MLFLHPTVMLHMGPTVWTQCCGIKPITSLNNRQTYGPLTASPPKGRAPQSNRGMNHSWEKIKDKRHLTIRQTLYRVYKTRPFLFTPLKRRTISLSKWCLSHSIESKLTNVSITPLQRLLLPSGRLVPLTLFMAR